MKKQLPLKITKRQNSELRMGVRMAVDVAVRQADKDGVPVVIECRGSRVVVQPHDETEVVRAMLCAGIVRPAHKTAVPLSLKTEVSGEVSSRPLQCTSPRDW